MFNGAFVNDGSGRVRGPWPCEKCQKVTQMAKDNGEIVVIFCTNCRYERIIDRKRRIVIEDNGRRWNIDSAQKPGSPYEA